MKRALQKKQLGKAENHYQIQIMEKIMAVFIVWIDAFWNVIKNSSKMRWKDMVIMIWLMVGNFYEKSHDGRFVHVPMPPLSYKY